VDVVPDGPDFPVLNRHRMEIAIIPTLLGGFKSHRSHQILTNKQESSINLALYAGWRGDIHRKFKSLTVLVGSILR